MDIGVDQSTPRGDLTRDEDGKYTYKITKNRNEVDRFNRDFEQYADRRKLVMQQQMNARLEELNAPQDDTPIYKKPIGTILIKTKDTVFDILDDMMQFKFSQIFTKDNRLFHIGVILLIITLTVFIIYTFDNPKDEVSKGIKKISITFDQ
jgi:hypothetical protein